jgi:hypothetical protein
MNSFPRNKYFWDWFVKNLDEYRAMHELSDEDYEYRMRELQIHLKAYCSHLQAHVINSEDNERNCLIISARLNRKYFKKVDKLVATAPEIEGWEMVSLFPPQPADYLVRLDYSHTGVNPEYMWFLPHEPDEAGRAAFIMFVRSPLSLDDNELCMAVKTVLLNVMGERSYCSDIEMWTIVSHPAANPQGNGVLPITELPAYIASLKSNFEIGQDGELREKNCMS